MSSFTDSMWQEIAPIYRAILDLPFNRELAAGTLGRERFVFYMIQDAHYLGMFSRALAATAAKAPYADAQIKFAKSAHDAIVVERALHEGFFRTFDVPPEHFAATPPSPTCAGYGDFLLATAYGQPFAVSTAALLPCFQIYYEVGKHLATIAAPDNPYQRWIDTYKDESFGDSVREVLDHTDRAFEAATAADRRAMREAYLKAARYEWMFWDSAWRLETWPV
ncbi:TenA family protein [Benzoatithermus flavus]|uniref:TenA family protein n=1 Tax=Benzoatithermus flavus TaxID=3108223 RepID=A0ABU8XQZ2_9PROT